MQGTKTVNINLCIGVVVKGRRRSSRDDVATGRDTASNGVGFVAIRPVSQYVVSPMKNPPRGGGVQTAYISETTVHLRFIDVHAPSQLHCSQSADGGLHLITFQLCFVF